MNLIASHDIAPCLQERGGKGPDSDCTMALVTHTLRAEGFDASEDGTGRGTPIVPVAFQERGRDDGRSVETQDDLAYALTAPNGGGRRHEMNIAAPVAYRTSGNSGVTEQGSKTAALNCNTDRTQSIVAFQCHGSNVGPMGAVRAGNGNEAGGVPFVPVTDQAYCLTDARGTGDGHGQGWNSNYLASPMAVRRLTPRECERLQGFPDDWTATATDGKRISDGPRYRMMGNAVCVNVAHWIGQRIMASESK